MKDIIILTDDFCGDSHIPSTCSRMPSWTQSMIPRIFYITEKAWNYYPFTKTGERDTMKGSKSKSLMPHMVLTGIQWLHFSNFSPPS